MALMRMTWALSASILLLGASPAPAQRQIVCSGEAAGGYAAFPDVCRLRNGDLFCVFYSGYGHVSTPNAAWPKGGRIMAVGSFGFKGHCPYLLRHSSGVILLAHRVPATSLHWTTDEGKTWNGSVKIDTVGGAYPSMVELAGGLVYCVYYEDGKGSSIRGVRLRVDKNGVTVVAKRN